MATFFPEISEPKTNSAGVVDFDIHGLVGVRLLAPSVTNVAAVSAQIGPPCSRLIQHPDIVVRYTDRVTTKTVRYVDVGKTGSSETGFILSPDGEGNGFVSIPFEQIGSECEILCERRVGWIPLLIPIINLTALKKHGCAPVHASAFVHEGTGVLVTGWVKSGKTEALLACSQYGATYIAGEWVLLGADGSTMYGLPGTFRMWEWQKSSLPHCKSIDSRKAMSHLIRLLDAVQAAIPEALLRFGPLKLVRQSMPALRRQLNFRVEPKAIFGQRCGSLTANLDKIFIGIVHSNDQIRIEPAAPSTVAEQLVCAMEFELTSLMSYYRAFKFAYPGKQNEFLEETYCVLRNALQKALTGKEIYYLYHPYPVGFDDLYRAMQKALGNSHLLAIEKRIQMKSGPVSGGLSVGTRPA